MFGLNNFRIKTSAIVLLMLMGCVSLAGAAPQAKDTLNAAIVKGDRGVKAIVKEAAKDFSKNNTDYYASFLIVRTIKNNGAFREVQGAVGAFASVGFNQNTKTKLYWDDKNAMGRIFVCDSFVSEVLFPNKNEVNPVLSVNSTDTQKDEDALKVNYSCEFDISALNRKRAIEIFSPLNPKMVGDFVYEDGGKDRLEGKDVRIIKFSSKSKTITMKNRITCSGRLFIDDSGRIRKVVVKDVDDRFTSYIRNFSGMTVVTPLTYTITYGEVNGMIYTESIQQELRWELPENHLDKLYCAETNSCRNPFRNHLETSFTATFSNPIMIKDTKNFGGSYPAYAIHDYYKTRDFDFWRNLLAKETDLERILKDTGCTWESLCKQTFSRSERGLLAVCETEEKAAAEIARIEARTTSARELYRKVFGKNYTEGF